MTVLSCAGLREKTITAPSRRVRRTSSVSRMRQSAPRATPVRLFVVRHRVTPLRPVPIFRPFSRRSRACFAVAVAIACASTAAQAADADLSGRWLTPDDRAHPGRGIVRLYEENGRWFGRIEGGDDDRAVCDACKDERHGLPMRDLLIIRDLKRVPNDPHAWDGGDVLDPTTGHVYRIKMRLDGDDRLVIHGYLGVSVIGRSQTWTRVR